ncbi:hypothetical protein F4803DRAFT_556144 [Xylaria telfairii]|nr:hypothetical protein F4803DRAFT_556144 [Xylaria telfairii]
MDHSLDGHGLSREQLQVKAEAAGIAGQLDGDSSQDLTGPPRATEPDDVCEWRGDAPDPELDDLAHACEKNQQQSRPADACDWRGDEPEQHEDELSRTCQPDNHAQDSDQHDEPIEEIESVQMPIPRLPKVVGIPELFLPDGDKSPGQKRRSPPGSGTTTRDVKQPEHGKRPKPKKAHAGNIASPSKLPPKEHETPKEYPAEGRAHSPWVDSLEQLPAAVLEKVNMGVKETLEAAASILAPSARKDSQSQEPTVMGNIGRSSGLAPVSAAPPPLDLYIPRTAQPPAEPLMDDERNGSNEDHKRESNRSEKKAQREARRKARQDKIKEKKETRKGEKERRRKEKEWKKTAKKGGELPLQIRQGLRSALGSNVPYNPKCIICTKAAASAMSSKKKDPKCTTCAKAAIYESTDQYLKSSKINLVELPSPDDLLNGIKKLLEKEKKGRGKISDDARLAEELLEHITEHVRDFAANGEDYNVRAHKCNQKGQPGHLGRQGLDGNRDSPTTTDGEQTISNSGLSTASSPPMIDWWVRAMSSKELPSTPYHRNSPSRTVTPFRR